MPPHTTVPPFLGRGERGRHERADRGENQRRIERFGRHLVGTAGPHRAERAREILCCFIAGSCEGEDLPPLIARHLRHNLCGGAEAVDADALALTCKTQCAVSDEPGA